MTSTIGVSTSYPATVPALSEVADIQVALRLLSYGTSSEPANDAAIVTNSVFGQIKSLATLKSTIASPTFTGTVTLPTGGTSAAPLKFVAGTNLTTPTYGALEATTNGIFLTNNPGTTTTGPGRGFVRAPQMVYAVANSTAATTNTPVSPFASANDVLSSLEPARAYRIKGTYYLTSTFTSGTATIQLAFAFSNAPVSFIYNYKTYKSTGVTAMDLAGLVSVNTGTTISSAVTATATYVVEFEGFLTTHATLASTLTPQFQMSTTGSSTVAIAGSYFEIEKLGTSTQTLISGNWA